MYKFPCDLRLAFPACIICCIWSNLLDLNFSHTLLALPFTNQIFDQIAEKSATRIFLSTDSEDVRKDFVNKYGERIVLYDAEFDPDQLRQTSLETAIIELFILAHCSKFYGTIRDNGYMISAFSILAKHLNDAKKKNVLPMFESDTITRENKLSPLVKKMKLINIKRCS